MARLVGVDKQITTPGRPRGQTGRTGGKGGEVKERQTIHKRDIKIGRNPMI